MTQEILGTDDLAEKVEKADGTVVLVFTAPW